MEQSFGLLKPDCLKRGLEGEVFALIKSSGLRLIAVRRVRLTEENVGVIWPSCTGEDFYEEMVRFSTSGDSIVFIVEGEGAIDRLTKLVGHYDPMKAEKGTIRQLLGASAMENIIHSTSDAKTHEREMAIFFSKQDDSRSCPAE